jgi:O-antigen ligase
VQPDWLMLGQTAGRAQFVGRASGPFGIPNSLAALLLVLLPPAVVLTFSPRAGAVLRILAGYLACAYIFGLALTVSRGAWLGLAVAVVVWPLLQGGENWRRRVGRTLVAGLAVLAAGVVVYLTVPTLRARFETLVEEAGERTRPIMWRGAWQLFRENPAFGSGAGSYNVAFERHRPEHYQLDSQWAHNDYLNTLSDYGIVGFGLFFGGAALVAFLALRRRASALLAPVRVAGDGLDTPRLQSALALGLLAFGLQLFVDFHLKIPALAMTLAVVAAILVRCAWPVAVAAPGRCGRWAGRVEGLIIVVAAVGLTGGMMNPHYRAEALRYPARQAIDRLSDVPTADYAPLLAPAKAALARAVSIDPANAQAWADLAYATALSAHAEPGRIRELGREAEQQAARALALGEVVPEFWVRHAVALDMQNRWLEAGESGMRALRLAPASATIWYYHAYHLSLNPVGLPQARAAVAICLRLDPNNRAAQVLRQQLATGQ